MAKCFIPTHPMRAAATCCSAPTTSRPHAERPQRERNHGLGEAQRRVCVSSGAIQCHPNADKCGLRRALDPPRNQTQQTWKEQIVPMTAHGITPCLWFDTQAEEAAKFYVSIFKNSKIGKISRYGNEGSRDPRQAAGNGHDRRVRDRGAEVHGAQRRPAIQVQRGGVVPGLTAKPRRRSTTSGASSPKAARRGPAAGSRTSSASRGRSSRRRCRRCCMDENSEKAQRVMRSMLQMRKIDLAALKRAQAA